MSPRPPSGNSSSTHPLPGLKLVIDIFQGTGTNISIGRTPGRIKERAINRIIQNSPRFYIRISSAPDMLSAQFSALLTLTLAAVAIAGPIARAPALDGSNTSWTIGKEARSGAQVEGCNSSWSVGKRAEVESDNSCWVVQAAARAVPDATVDSDNKSWTIGKEARAVPDATVDGDNKSWTIGKEARAVPDATVDGDNKSWTIGKEARAVEGDNKTWVMGRAAPTPVVPGADLVDSGNTSWKIGRSLPTPVARVEAVDSGNDSWTIKANKRTAPTPVL
ncbi:hypothetical protein DFH09DRAFT_51519 [Mycena vulgaris]|nr:hypothetical protein DFH09DRAFT_51519 [Mycena vulgaris]